MFVFENRTDFFKFFKETYKTIKRISSNISFGSSPVFADTLEGSNDWMDTFIDFCKINNCLPDFINAHLACFNGGVIPNKIKFNERIDVKYFTESNI